MKVRNLRSVEPILDKNGEVIRPLSPYKKAVEYDFHWLETKGNQRLSRLFSKGVVDLTPDQRPLSVLKRASYIIGCQLADSGRGQKLADYMQHQPRNGDFIPKVNSLAPQADQNPFFWCLHLLAGWEDWLTRDQRSKAARQLKYAYRHQVPPQYLTGFILQIGSNEAALRSSTQAREEWLKENYHSQWHNVLNWPNDA